MSNIKYKYALNSSKEIISIDEVNPEIRKTNQFKCISCGKDLSACLGSKNKHHFRHKTDVDCNFETYLHKMGKHAFIKTYTDCLTQRKPFNITIKRKVSCSKEETCPIKPIHEGFHEGCSHYDWQTFDLTQYYDSISEERPIDSFVADVLLTSSKGHQPILVEIKVSHACEEGKIQSGYPIIEIGLEKEEDLELIESCQLKETESINEEHSGIIGYGLKMDKAEEPIIKCYNFRNANMRLLNLYKVHQFAVLRDNPSHFSLNETISCGEKDKLIERHRKENKLLYEILFFEDNLWGYDRFVFGVSKAFERGIKIRNCYLCKYHASNENRLTPDVDKPIFCKMYKIIQTKPQCHSTQAINCTAFNPSKGAYERYLFYSYKCEEIVY